GQLITSGSSRTRKSVTVRIRSKHVKKSHFTVACVMPNSKNAVTKSNPVASSISGYITEIGAPHARHFPRSHSQANSGTLSYGLMGVPHRGQRDPGVTMEISSGIRVMQTFKKLPTIIPNRKKKTVMMTTVCPATPRPLFPICHTHPTASINRPSSRAPSLTLSSSTSPLFSARSAHRFSLFCPPVSRRLQVDSARHFILGVLQALCVLCVNSFLCNYPAPVFLFLELTTVD